MTTVDHYLYLIKFCELLACQLVLENRNLCLEPTRLFNYFHYDVSDQQELETA